MKIRCAWHKKHFGFDLIMGEKAPFEDTSFTDGICDDCLLHYFPHQYARIKRITDDLRTAKELDDIRAQREVRIWPR